MKNLSFDMRETLDYFVFMAARKATFAVAQRPDVLLKRSDERLQIRSSGRAISRQAVSQ